jgi:prephenate dehydrogenase
MSNREEVLKQTSRFRHTLEAMELAMTSGNVDALEDMIRSASEARGGWQMNAASKPVAGR